MNRNLFSPGLLKIQTFLWTVWQSNIHTYIRTFILYIYIYNNLMLQILVEIRLKRPFKCNY